MANIEPYINEIQTAIYGEEVRGSIVNGIKAINTENETLNSTINNAVQTTLTNFKVYEYTDQLPEVGNPQLIYAVTDIEYISSDNDTNLDDDPSTGKTYWDNDNSSNAPYLQVSTSEVDAGDGIEFSKPVAARYYLSSATVSYKDVNNVQRNVDIYSVTMTEQDCKLIMENRQSHPHQSHPHQSWGEEFIGWAITAASFRSSYSPHPNQPATITIEFHEFVYDIDYDDEIGWKYNKTITLTKSIPRNIISPNGTNIWTITISPTYSNKDFLLLTYFNQYWRTKFEEGYALLTFMYAGSYVSQYTSLDDFIEDIYDPFARLMNDAYGYDGYSHSVDYLLCAKGNSSLAWRVPETVPTTQNVWNVPVAAGSTAHMYVWIQALMTYIEIVGDDERMPVPPAEDGTYTLKCVVDDGEPTFTWVLDN